MTDQSALMASIMYGGDACWRSEIAFAAVHALQAICCLQCLHAALYLLCFACNELTQRPNEADHVWWRRLLEVSSIIRCFAFPRFACSALPAVSVEAAAGMNPLKQLLNKLYFATACPGSDVLTQISKVVIL